MTSNRLCLCNYGRQLFCFGWQLLKILTPLSMLSQRKIFLCERALHITMETNFCAYSRATMVKRMLDHMEQVTISKTNPDTQGGISSINIKWRCPVLFHKARLFLFVGLHYPTIWKIGISKKKKKRIFPDTTAKLFVFGLIRNCWENNYFKTPLSFGKPHKNCDKWGPCLFFFFFLWSLIWKISVDVT